MSNLSTQPDLALIIELQSRGYMTNLLFNRYDVDNQLQSVNDDLKGINLTMTDEQKDFILDTELPIDRTCENINDAIYGAIYNMFSEEIGQWEDNDLSNKMRNSNIQ
jgi:hypothetical protein